MPLVFISTFQTPMWQNFQGKLSSKSTTVSPEISGLRLSPVKILSKLRTRNYLPSAVHMGPCLRCHVSPSISQRSKKYTRYQLPGFGLPLNFTPNNEFTSHEYDFKTKCDREIVYPQLGEYGALYPNTLDGQRARQVISILSIKFNLFCEG